MLNMLPLTRRLRTALAILAAGTALATPSIARSYGDPTWADGSLVDVQLLVDGRPTSLYDSPQGDRRHYFEAIAGGRYSVVLRNNSSQRVGVLISVDGLNVVNGERTSLASTEPMYVLGPWQSTTINGWRTSLDAVRRFVFVDEQRSYAERTGQANGDMGWIRVLAFREQRPWWDRSQGMIRDERLKDVRDRLDGQRSNAKEEGAPLGAAPPTTASPEPARDMASRESMQKSQGMAGGSENSYPGTGWGDKRHDPVQQVQFTAERYATDNLVFRYEYASGLQALGIYFHRNRLRERDGGELGFAKPPRW
jgi:hypothetical protein